MRDPKKWFQPKKHSGWRKAMGAEKRRALLLKNTDKRKTKYKRLLEAARRIQALANVTEDRETALKARADAKYLFRLARRLRSSMMNKL